MNNWRPTIFRIKNKRSKMIYSYNIICTDIISDVYTIYDTRLCDRFVMDKWSVRVTIQFGGLEHKLRYYNRDIHKVPDNIYHTMNTYSVTYYSQNYQDIFDFITQQINSYWRYTLDTELKDVANVNYLYLLSQ